MTKLRMVTSSCFCSDNVAEVQFSGPQQEPAAVRDSCLHMYEKHKVWSLLLVAYFCGFVFALLSLLPLKSFPHQVQRKQRRERVLFFSAPMAKQQQLTGAAVWWPADVTPAVVKESALQSHLHTVAFSLSSYNYFNAYLGQGSGGCWEAKWGGGLLGWDRCSKCENKRIMSSEIPHPLLSMKKH